MRTPILSVLAALALGACHGAEAPKLPSMPAAFAAIPLPPNPEYLGQSGSEDALMFTFRSPTVADSVTAYYDKLFAHDTAYHVMGSNPGAAGEHAFYVEYHARPLWVRIRPEAGNTGSIVELTGAVVAPAAPAAPVDTSNHARGTNDLEHTKGERRSH